MLLTGDCKSANQISNVHMLIAMYLGFSQEGIGFLFPLFQGLETCVAVAAGHKTLVGIAARHGDRGPSAQGLHLLARSYVCYPDWFWYPAIPAQPLIKMVETQTQIKCRNVTLKLLLSLSNKESIENSHRQSPS